jgi:eukaryotic-like serine/threonine-protein kinase
VQIFDFGESEGTYFIAMEYIDGPSLRTLIQRAAAQRQLLPPEVCARLISLACDGLAFAHDFTDPETGEAQGIIHRDVSPDNILLSRQGAVKVVDFGIAKATGQSHKTESGIVKGKLPYMPPEQLRAKPVDRRADVYALGVVLYELLTGQRPYASESEAGLMQAILYEPPIPAAKHRQDIPDHLRRILHKVLSKDRDERYADCHAFQDDLEAFIRNVGKTVMTKQVADLINRTTTDPGGLPVAKEPRKTPTPTIPTTPGAPPGLTRKRPSSPTNEAPTANHRPPQAPTQEEPRALATPPPRRTTSEQETAPGRRPPRPIAIPTSDRGSQEQPTSKRRPSERWALASLAILLIAAASGVVVVPRLSWIEWDAFAAPKPRVAATSPAQVETEQPSESAPSPNPDKGNPDVGPAVDPPIGGPKPPPPSAPRVRGEGTLELRIQPYYAIVFMDGRKLGVTPMDKLRLPAGLHTLKFVNKKLGKTIQREVDIKAGQETLLKLDMSED